MASLTEIEELFREADPETRLYLLLDHADRLPALPEQLIAARDAGAGRVHECQTPVFLYPEITGTGDGRRVRIHADVPRDSPTVRGLVALLVEALEGESPAAVQSVPDDLLHRLGLAEKLGARRQMGFAGVLAALKRTVAAAAA